MDERTSILDALDRLDPHGLFDVALIEADFAAFGFGYDSATDSMTYGAARANLGSRTVRQAKEFLAGQVFGWLNDSIPDDMRLVTSADLSAAIAGLVLPGIPAPSLMRHLPDGAGFDDDLQLISLVDGLARGIH